MKKVFNKGKKAQAILPFFALQLVAVIIFFIVLLSLLSMTRNVDMVVGEFDKETAFLLAARRMFSSADCLAFEKRSVVQDDLNGELIYGSRVFSGIVDEDKLKDYDHFNCMRKDFYDKVSDVNNGVWDAELGSGAVFRYSLMGYDAFYSVNEFVFNDDLGDNDAHFANSYVGRVNKKEKSCNDNLLTDLCVDKYGGSYDCVNQWCDYPWADQELEKKQEPCDKGRCFKSTEDEISVKPLWEYNSDVPYTFVELSGDHKVFETDTSGQYFKKSWDQDDDTCLDSANSKKGVFPIMMEVDGELHPTIVLFETCIVEGDKYEGRNIFEVQYKPKQGSECVGG